MRYDEATEGHGALYVCDREHRTGTEVRLEAHVTDRLVISGVLTAVLTKGGITTVQSATGDFEEQEDADSSFPAEDIGLLKEDLYLFLGEVDRAERAGNFLGTFITRIKLFPDRAVVQYAVPLPSHSHPPGTNEQEINFTA